MISALKSESEISAPDLNRVVILGAGRSVKGSDPSAIAKTDNGHRVLDWLLESFSVLGELDTYFVGGYRVERIAEEFPNIRLLYNPDWAETGPAHTLGVLRPQGTAPTFVCYSDIIFRSDVVRAVQSTVGDVVLAVDSQWRTRYDNRSTLELDAAEKIRGSGGEVTEIGRHIELSQANSEFIGLLKLSENALASVFQAIADKTISETSGICELVSYLISEGFTALTTDVQGAWAHLNAPQDLARFILGTKAESLERLRPMIRKSQIGEQVTFRYEDWSQNQSEIISSIQSAFLSEPVIVRSSALSEDTWHESAAGAFKSLLDIDPTKKNELLNAIDEVFASYNDINDENQVLIQKMVSDVAVSGVIMTRTPSNNSPYYVINFDTSGSTESVTAGEGSSLRTIFVHRGADLPQSAPEKLTGILDAVSELENLVGHDSLDIEFAVNDDPLPHILQVRPIAATHGFAPIDDNRISSGLRDCQRYFRELNRSSALLLGNRTQFSVMADWNPAEMIGTKPQPLAFSLYQHLITSESWAKQRAEVGYRDVRPCSLMVDFLGHPYIDLRVDFNSFVPARISSQTAEKLVNYYLDVLEENPESHDKIEFDIVISCMSLDFSRQSEELLAAGFTPNEIADLRSALIDITLECIRRCKADEQAISLLDEVIKKIDSGTDSPLERAYLLIEYIRRVAIPLFSHLARHAFVAVTILKSFVKADVLTQSQLDSFLESMRTVPSVMQDHAQLVVQGELAWRDFVTLYGHLRPGSYDILSACYADAPGEFLQPVVDRCRSNSRSEQPQGDSWPPELWQSLEGAVFDIGLQVPADELRGFIKTAIEGREFAKFEFMKGVNAALKAIIEFGELHGIGKDKLALIRIQDLFSLRRSHADSVETRLLELARHGREATYISQAICLPGQIYSESDFLSFEQKLAEPNFITRKSVRAGVCQLAERAIPRQDLSGKIVLIENADPGYDWLFSRNIGGLITMYGGVNSHMAIRAAEFGLPSAIGVGELLFGELAGAEVIFLDCGNRKIEAVR